MSAQPPLWSSDVPISMPQAPEHPVVVPMGGLGITQYGLAHDLTEAEFEYFRRPSYAPEPLTDDVVYDDGEVDQ